ncbi:MAG: hypothetical protein B0D92_01030 [Spirochaeta sp. LUC14_002_19_P3]|nr:MAG: hypothetical protein B0D92_01030 [Spirochaeta sp. LUC14_002_19_P3]
MLSDTDRFVSRANLMERYEPVLRQWRASLQKHRLDNEKIHQIRDEIIAFRRARREEGWELRLGSLDIQLKGFRSDDAMGLGFRRMILMAGESGAVRYITGSANHIQLSEELRQQIQYSPHAEPMDTHYLWYRRMEGIIELAGADSQSKESHEHLKNYIDRHKSAMVKALYNIS